MCGQRILRILLTHESLDSFHTGDTGSPGFGPIEQYRLHNGVEDPDFSAGSEEWWSPDILQPLESCSHLADASIYIPFCPPPPVLSTMLPRYVKLSTSCSASPSSIMRVSVTVLTFRTLLIPLWILRPKRAETSATTLVFSCIWCRVCERKTSSSA